MLDYRNVTAKDLTQWRRDEKISRNKLSQILGTHLSTVYRWEHNKTRIPHWLGIVLVALEADVLKWEEFNES
jgi:DNA-binding transcriptional regulator YiaG